MPEEVAAVATPEADAPVIADDASLSEHEALFGAPDLTLEGDAKTENDAKRAKVRHRAASQDATPADVPRIQRLSKDVRERDEKLSAAEARIAALEARLTSEPSSAPADSRQPAQVQPSGSERGASGQYPKLEPTRPKPKMAMIDDGVYDSFEAYNEDLVDWKQEQKDAARAAEDVQRQQERQRTDAHQSFQKVNESFATRLSDFKKTHADYDTLAQQHMQTYIPPAGHRALLEHDNGPELVYYLFQHPDVLAEMQLLLDGRPPTADYVAIATRWLSSRALAASTGSAVPKAPLKPAPPPPNPVRTGHTNSGDEIPDDDAPISAHEAKWGQRRR